MSVSSSITVCAPGKVILHGEHAVVYGKVGIAAAIGLKTTTNLFQTKGSSITLRLQDLDTCCTWEKHTLEKSLPLKGKFSQLEKLFPEFLSDAAKEAAKVFLFLFGGISCTDGRLPGVTVTVSSTIPTGAGLGSSAAYSVTLSAALLINKGSILLPTQATTISESVEHELTSSDLEQISKWAFEAEKLIHGSPSGIDNSISTYGGMLMFEGGAINHLKCVPSLQVLLINTKVPRSTKAMVAGLRKRYEKMPSIYDSILEAISNISKESLNLLDELFRCQHTGNGEKERDVCECFDHLGTLIDINHNLLKALGVSHESLDSVCRLSRKHGLYSKLTGAGGGGFAIVLLRHDTSKETLRSLLDKLKDMGMDVTETKLGSHGIRVQAS